MGIKLHTKEEIIEKWKQSGLFDGLNVPSKKRIEELNTLYGSKTKHLINEEKIYFNQEVTDFIINKYGRTTLDHIISGELLLNDKKIDELMYDYWRICGTNTEHRIFKIPVGDLTKDEVYSVNELIKIIKNI